MEFLGALYIKNYSTDELISNFAIKLINQVIAKDLEYKSIDFFERFLINILHQ